MIVAGCDVGSLTAEAVIIKDDSIISARIMGVKANSTRSATVVMEAALKQAGLSMNALAYCCSTGYGRFNIPFANMNKSEISCHGLGAFHADNTIRTVIDIGGQDCKVISIDTNGMVRDFIMNDKCAAGTGRNLELLAKVIDVKLDQLGPLSLKSRKPAVINNRCSIFMELEVINHLYRKKKITDISYGINEAVAKRVAVLSRAISLKKQVTITGGVSKNTGVVRCLESITETTFKPLPLDPQLIGAYGAALFALKELQKNKSYKS